ncbi:MAG: hypothetical protein IKS52_05650, partial [Clostridia bacterium]|nr:hypothetical protein [Clostridia bacterium]
MSERVERKKGGGRRLTAIVLFVLAAILLIGAIGGYLLRGTADNRTNLDKMRTSAVLHAASEGLVENIAQQARADKLKELRADKDFRKRGLDEVNAICDAARDEARAEAERMYANPVVNDEAALESAISRFEGVLQTSGTLYEKERSVYAGIYVSLVEN